jgi:hypothetical protein
LSVERMLMPFGYGAANKAGRDRDAPPKAKQE